MKTKMNESEKILYRNALPVVRLHGRVKCHMNGHFVGFQNMCDFKMSDYQHELSIRIQEKTQVNLM